MTFRRIRLELTNKCNWNCAFCHNEGQAKHGQIVLPVSAIIRASEFAKWASIEGISLTGGEPLLHPNIFAVPQLIKHIYPAVSLGLTTNGDLLNEEKEEFLIPYFDRIHFNLQSIVPEIHREITLARSGIQRMEKIERIAARWPDKRITINLVAGRRNIDQLEATIEWCIENGIFIKIFQYVDQFGEYDQALWGEVFGILKRHSATYWEERWRDTIFQLRGDLRAIMAIAYCNSKDGSACRELGELRVRGNGKIGHCLISEREDIHIESETFEDIKAYFGERKGHCE